MLDQFLSLLACSLPDLLVAFAFAGYVLGIFIGGVLVPRLAYLIPPDLKMPQWRGRVGLLALLTLDFFLVIVCWLAPHLWETDSFLRNAALVVVIIFSPMLFLIVNEAWRNYLRIERARNQLLPLAFMEIIEGKVTKIEHVKGKPEIYQITVEWRVPSQTGFSVKHKKLIVPIAEWSHLWQNTPLCIRYNSKNVVRHIYAVPQESKEIGARS